MWFLREEWCWFSSEVRKWDHVRLGAQRLYADVFMCLTNVLHNHCLRKGNFSLIVWNDCMKHCFIHASLCSCKIISVGEMAMHRGITGAGK